MATVIYGPQALLDLSPLIEFKAGDDGRIAALLLGAITNLEQHPLMGRQVENGLRELVISRSRTGYLALYDYVAAEDAVYIRAIRHQKEVRYSDPQDHADD